MSKKLKKILSAVMAVMLLIAVVPADGVGAVTVPTDTMKIGLYYGSNALVSANLQNAVGTGYEFGYYDADRKFVSVGSTPEKAISMLVDKNLHYNSTTNSYDSGTDGDIVVGCFHLRLNKKYPDFDSAKAAADAIPDVDTFVKYLNGDYYMCMGNFTSSAAAAAEAGSYGISDYTFDSGTSRTIAVVKSGTNNIIFEYDCGTSSTLGVRPYSPDEKSTTWFKGFKYYGGFQYERRSDTGMTVVNVVPVEDYVKGVLPYEMSASWPIEALKAQAICARNYAVQNLNKHKANGFDICNNADCQVYRGINASTANSDSAAEQTAGMYLCCNDTLCTCYYYSSNGGASEDVENVWSGVISYLRGVEDPYEAVLADKLSGYYWMVTYTPENLAAKLRSYSSSCSGFTKIVKAEPTYTKLGNVLSIKFTDVSGKTFTLNKRAAATAIGLSTQRYTVTGGGASGEYYANDAKNSIGQDIAAFFGIGSGGVGTLTSGGVYAITGNGTVEEVQQPTSADADKFVFNGSGNGHNVGMSQWGAYSMAKNFGKTCEEILNFYYYGTEVKKIV